MKIAMLFPGYGSQYVGMGKELYDQSRIMQEYFEEASNCLNINFVKLCFASSDADISRVDNALLCNFLISASLVAVLKDHGISPDIVVGHTSGEYAAIHAAGGISFPDMLYMLQKYTLFYQEILQTLPLKAVRVIGLPVHDVTQPLKQYQKGHEPAYISAYETETEHVVSGYASTVDSVRETYMANGAKKVVELHYIDGYHSVIMKSVYDHLIVYTEKVDFKDLHIPLMTMTKAKLIQAKEEVKSEMLEQIVLPERWYECAKSLADYDVLIEVGPGTTLTDKLKKKYVDKKIIAVNKDADVQLLKKALSFISTDEQVNNVGSSV